MRCAAACPSASRPGRSHTNADLVAGRDRVRVHATLHEHTGHGLAEVAAHLHTTVDGTLDVHAGNEDTVLLAGHMRDLWDGGTAIVAAMTDDTAAGGGIRVTAPLDLWVHGLMGVEERIGTCTADAVLTESSATHYEREYGPGVHAAGLAVYTGSLYQSSRSSFRPLMRVSSGVRNLIAGGGGGDGGGVGNAGSAPGASPPPVPAAGGAETDAASETLRAATGAGADQTAQTGGMAGGRSEDLTGIHRGDDVAAMARRENVAGGAGDLTGLHRGTDTAEQLRALHDAMRGTEAGAQGEEGSIFRFSQSDDTASVHEARGPDVVVDIPPGAPVPGMDAPELHSTVSPPPGATFGLLGGGDRPPRPAPPESDFPAVYRRLNDLRNHYLRLSVPAIASAIEQAAERISGRLLYQFELYGGNTEELARRPPRHHHRGASVPRPPGNGWPGRTRRQNRAGCQNPRGPGGHRRGCHRGVAIAVHEIRPLRSPVHPGDAATTGDRWPAADRRGHPTAGPHFHSNRPDLRLQAVARPGPSLPGDWPGCRPCELPNGRRPFFTHSHARVQAIRWKTRRTCSASPRRLQDGTGVQRHAGNAPSS